MVALDSTQTDTRGELAPTLPPLAPMTAGGEPPGPTLSPLQSIVGIFTNPRATFESLAAKPRVLVPMLLVILLQFGFSYAVIRSGAVLNDTVAKLEAKGESPEKIAMIERVFSEPVPMALSMVSGSIAVGFMLLVSAGLMFFMGNLMLRATLTYRHYLCVVSYGAVVGIADQTVRTVLAVKQETLDLRLGLGAFLGDDIGTAGRLLDTVTDPLLLWATAISALGVSVFARKSFGFGVLTVLPGFLLSVILSGLR
jgi:hypothetical protein